LNSLAYTLPSANHITDWPKLYNLSNKRNCWRKIGAIYDVARMYFRVRKMPKKYRQKKYFKKTYLIQKYPTTEKVLIPIEKKWRVSIPFRIGDINKVRAA